MPATTPTKFIMRRVVGGIRRVVHLNMYSSAKSPSSSEALEVTVKLVSIPASTLSKPWKTAKRCAETPPMTQNCSFLHHSSIPTPLHLISRIPVAKMDRKREMNHMLARLLICKRSKSKLEYYVATRQPRAWLSWQNEKQGFSGCVLSVFHHSAEWSIIFIFTKYYKDNQSPTTIYKRAIKLSILPKMQWT